MKGTPEEKAAWQREYRRQNREHVNTRDAARKFGITYEQARTLRDQEHCDICGVHFIGRSKDDRRHSIDHSHAKGGPVRGVLCVSCNTGLGKFFDNPETLRRAADYLENPPFNG